MLKFVSTIVLSVVFSVGSTLGLIKVHQGYVAQHTALVEQSWQNMRASVRHIDRCSGVMIEEGLMLTAAHCDTGAYEVVKKDSFNDLMLIKVNMACPCAPLAKDIKKDDIVRAVGYPLDRSSQFLTEGRVQDSVVFEYPQYMVHSAPTIFGNSGGGVFNERGELVGITSAVAVYATGWDGIPFVVPHMSYAVNLTTIKAFLER